MKKPFNWKAVFWFLARVLLAAGTLCACFVLFEFSMFAPGTTQHLLSLKPEVIWLNVATLGVVLALFVIVTNRVWLACMLTSLLCGALAVLNFYVLKYHSMPLSFLLVRNVTTALNVLDGYIIYMLEDRVKKMLYLTGALVAAGIALGVLSREKGLHGWKRWLRNGALVAAGVAVIYTGYFGKNPIKPMHTLRWTWEEPYGKYGFVPCAFESGYQLFNAVNQPEGYTQQAADAIQVEEPKAQASDVQPDIILILNESFYDIGQLLDVETDIPYMEGLQGMDNLLMGYAVTPSAGGGTNSTEYELLTGNSLWLMPGVTPFNSLDLDGANSVVSHLSSLGYNTLATHVEPAINYSRSVAYPALGFDRSYFTDEYRDVEIFGHRYFRTDESVYRNCIRWYNEDMGQDAPRFMYVLTIQNHGPYTEHDAHYDTVHVQGDWGELGGELNEYLSLVHLSSQAFQNLTEYFATVDRPVVICMVGDHSPTFRTRLPDTPYSGEEMNLRKRKVPLLIWANFDLEQKELGTMSMNMVMPTVLDVANVTLSPYYQYMLELKERVPILTSYGKYYDAQGNSYNYDSDEGGAYEKWVDDYFYLEYQSVKTNHNREMYQPY